jgi:DNA-binding NtrC family response regulator
MAVALFSSQTVFLSDVVNILRQEGICVSDYSLKNSEMPMKLSDEVNQIFLIFEEHGVAEIVDNIRNKFGKDRKVTLCCHHQSNANYELLSNIGVNEFITPKLWSSDNIAERILAYLIVEKGVEPINLGNLYGGTLVMRDVYKEIQTISTLSDPILILGETGTGKDVVAKEIHRLSNRQGNYIALNCSEFSQDIIESELFGHTKGSFTGANSDRKGLLLESGSGTVFLDEIGELPMPLQSKLLRVIEEKKVRPVGANNWIDIKCRFILATNRNIEKEIELGNFRQDLFERIGGFCISLPSLREKMADVILLFNLFLKEYCKEYNQEICVPPHSLDSLFNYSWKGNVRELRAFTRNLAAHSIANGDKFFVSPIRMTETINQRIGKEVENTLLDINPLNETLEQVLLKVEIQYLKKLLELTGKNSEKAIELSGLSKSTFYEKKKIIFQESDKPKSL